MGVGAKIVCLSPFFWERGDTVVQYAAYLASSSPFGGERGHGIIRF